MGASSTWDNCSQGVEEDEIEGSSKSYRFMCKLLKGKVAALCVPEVKPRDRQSIGVCRVEKSAGEKR